MPIRISGLSSGMDTEALVSDLVSAYKKKGDTFTKKRTKTEWKQEAWTNLNNKIKNFHTKYASNMRFSSNYSKKSTTVSDTSKATIVTADSAANGTQTLAVKALAKSGYLTGGVLATDGNGQKVTKDTTLGDLGYTKEGTTTITISKGVAGNYSGQETFDVDASTTVEEFAKLVRSAGYNANFDENNGRFFISSKESGAANNFEFTGGTEVTDLLNLTGADSGATKITGSDAKIILNDVEFTSSSNTFSVNGLTITAKEVTGNETDGYNKLTITTDTDYDSIYNNIKDFLKEYNSLINEMDKLFNAPSSKGYEPLTDEEKDAMSDTEIEKWESKIKDALLKGDSDLDKIASTMRNAMLQTVKIDGQTYSLSSFGIETMSYFEAPDNEKNAFHINGDPDDSVTSGKADKLKSMIATNPSVVEEFFEKLSTKLYDSMNKIQTTSDNYTSYGSFYGDKKLKSDYDGQTKDIDNWEKKVKDIEDRYYKQFAAMEKAMSSINSQQQYLGSLFGMQ